MSIKFDKRNYRKHNNKNKDLIKKSLEECGTGRSIVIDNENEIIAGNGIYEQAQKLGIKTKIIETDGTELVVVKRTDLSTNDEKRKQLAIMDNTTSDTSEFDFNLLAEDFEIKDFKDFGIFDSFIQDELDKKTEKDNKEYNLINNENIKNIKEQLEAFDFEYERIIISYKKDEENLVKSLLKLKEINKSFYNVKELTNE